MEPIDEERIERREEVWGRRNEDHIVRNLQAWLIPILLAVIGSLVYPLVSQIHDQDRALGEHEKNIAVLVTQIDSMSKEMRLRFDAEAVRSAELARRMEALEEQIRKH